MVPDRPTPPRNFERNFETVARKISAMVQADYRVGQRLPAERELAKTFGVSRPTVREAILSLVLAGMLQVRSNSGAYVVGRREPPDVQALEGCGPFENLEARQLIEPQIAAIAARTASAPLLARLGDCIDAMRREHEAGREADAADLAFHIVLAESTGNNALVAICDGLWRGQIGSRIWREIHLHMPMADYRPVWLADHEAILAAVQAGSARRAAAAMTRHLAHIHRALMASSDARAMAGPIRAADEATPDPSVG